MAMNKIKKNDMVRVIAGKDKGKDGKVVSVKNGRAVVEGINQVTKHVKPNQSNPNGGIIKMDAPLDVSNLMYLSQGKPSRVGFKIENGKKVRFAKATGEVID